MLFEEFTNPIMPERQETEEPQTSYTDPELARVIDRVSAKYPYYKKGTEGFMKYASRAIRHSEEADQEHTARFDQLDREIADLKQTIAKLQQR